MTKNGLRLSAAAAAFLAAAALEACFIPPAPDGEGAGAAPQNALISGVFPGLDPGASELDGLHFQVYAYGSAAAQQTSDDCEKSYTRIMTDTNLNSFQPHGMYSITVYGSQDEYRKKTGQPDWSAGVTVGNAIYVYDSPVLDGVLAHEMTHLIWYEFMNGDLNSQKRWVNEGLAVYEEAKARNHGHELFAGLLPALRAAPIPIDQLRNAAPNSEQAYDASLWYAESESMIRYMIERGGRIGFGQFLGALQANQTFDQAIAVGFPGKWQTLAAFEADWKQNLQ